MIFDCNPLRVLVAKLLRFSPLVPIQWMGHTSVSRGMNGTDLVGCIISRYGSQSRLSDASTGGASNCVTRPKLTNSSSLRGPSPRL